MKIALTTIIFFSLIVLVISCSSPDTATTKKGPISFSAQLGGWYAVDTTASFIQIRVTLKNNTADTQAYVNMLCSWRDCYTTNDENNFYLLRDSLCFLNAPAIYKIPPMKSSTDFLTIKTTIPFKDWDKASFRIGFNLIMQDTARKLFSYADELRAMKNITWSDSLALKEFDHFSK